MPILPGESSKIWRLNAIALWALIATVSIFAGLLLRDWTWKQTQTIRFQSDITNALNIGRGTVMGAMSVERDKPLEVPDWAALWKSYLSRYDVEFDRMEARRLRQEGNVRAGDPRSSAFVDRYRFDYPPGRLLVASAWAKHAIGTPRAGETAPRGMGVGYEDELAAPLRWLNIGHELAAALAMFFLVRRVFILSGRRWFISETLAMLASLFVWFNPALILNAHGWPQWEAWVLPYTLWAAYFALVDCWLVAGILLAVGAMLKGQVLMFAPIFPLWALFSFRFGGLLRLAVGFLFAIALLMSPWLLRDALPAIWVIGGTGLLGLFAMRTRSRVTQSVLPLFILFGWIAGPWLFPAGNPTMLIVGGVVLFLLASVSVVLIPFRIFLMLPLAVTAALVAALLPATLAAYIGRSPPEWLTIALPLWTYSSAPLTLDPYLLKVTMGILCAIGGVVLIARRQFVLPATLATFAALAFIAATQFNGSFAWIDVGFQTQRYDELFMGRVSNLPAILQRFHGLDVESPVSTFGVLAEPMLLSPFLKTLAGIGLVLCALSLSIQLRRRDPNALIAFAALWVVLYAFLPQMHERYLTWGAVVSAVLVTRGIGGLLAHLAITAVQVAMMLLAMSSSRGRGANIEGLAPWVRAFAGMQPAIGYLVATLALVLLCWSFRRSVPKPVRLRKMVAPSLLIHTPKPAPAGDRAISTADSSPASA